jgi:hypothetical protein
MKRLSAALLVAVALGAAGLAPAKTRRAPVKTAPAAGAGLEKQVADYAALFLPS